MAMKEFRTSTNTITDRSKDSVASYLREVSRMKPISAEEEAELARIIRRGGADALAARERLINANLRFVISVANTFKSHTLEFGDIISEGNYGLIKAVELFDETKGFKFISYAVWWIRQSIMAALDNSCTTLRLPKNQQNILRDYRQMEQDMLQKEQRSVTIEEFCEVSGYDYDKVLNVLQASYKPVYTDDSLNEDSDATYGDFFIVDSATDADLDNESLYDDLDFVFDKVLTYKERYVVESLYGVGRKQKSLEEVADDINLSRERTRQICAAALKKVCESDYSSRLFMHLAA